MTPPGAVRYARSGELRIAYEQFGDGEVELVVVPGFISDLDQLWGLPPYGALCDRLEGFADAGSTGQPGRGASVRAARWTPTRGHRSSWRRDLRLWRSAAAPLQDGPRSKEVDARRWTR